VWGGNDAGPTFVTYTSRGGERWVLFDGIRSCWTTIAHPGETGPMHCAHSIMGPAAFFDDGRLLAAGSDDSAIHVFDRKLKDTGTSYSVQGLLPQQIVPAGERLLVVVADVSDGSSHVLGCSGNGPCERAADAGPGETVVLAHQ
jgi:hypothetical protein